MNKSNPRQRPALAAKYNRGKGYSMRELFINILVSAYARGEAISNTQAAIEAGYSPNGADVQAARLLGDIRVSSELDRRKAEIDRKRDAKTVWTLDKSARIAEEEFERLKTDNPPVAFRYKENLDRIHGFLIDKVEQRSTQTHEFRAKLDHLSVDQLTDELTKRLKVVNQGLMEGRVDVVETPVPVGEGGPKDGQSGPE